MLIHNTTFMTEPGRESEFLQWFRTQMPELTGDGTAPRLSALRMAAGQEAGEEQAHSMAFQMEFDDIVSLVQWADGPLQSVTLRFMKHFGPNAVFFTSVFETIPL